MVKTNDPGIANKTRKTRLVSIQISVLRSLSRHLQQYTSSIYCDVKRMSNDNTPTITMYAL